MKQRYTITYTVCADHDGESIDPSQLLDAAQQAAWDLHESIGAMGLDASVEDVDGEGNGDGPCVEPLSPATAPAPLPMASGFGRKWR
jgi:hypothetical protein